MSSSKHPSLEDTISIYKSKFLIDLDDEIDDGPIPSASRDEEDDNEIQTTSQDLRAEPEDDNSDAKETSRVRKSRLPRDLAGLMGQANICFARRLDDDAILMCQEVIRLAPRCADPFISLAEHYHNIEDEEKAEQLYLIAAYLQPSNSHLWVKVAESATKRREFRLAATCFTKAIRADKNESCISYHLRRCNLYEKLGDQKKALRGYENLIAALGPDDQEFGLELARGIARIYLKDNKIDSCIRTIEGSLDRYSSQLLDDDIAQLCSCYNLKKLYAKTIDVMVKKTGVNIKFTDSSWNLDKMNEALDKNEKIKLVLSLDPKPNPRFSFRNKCLLLVALIELGYCDETIRDLVPNLDNIDIQLHRNSLYEIAQAYYSQNEFQKAKEILIMLTSHRDSQVASIWLLYSQCLKNLNEIDKAIEGYRQVLEYEPDDYSSRLALSNLFSVQGRFEEALNVTKQPLFTDKPVDIPLLYQSCELLAQSKNWKDYCDSAKALILTDMIYTQHPKEIMCMITSRSFRTRLDNLRFVQRELNQQSRSNSYRQKSVGTRLDSSTMLKTFLRYINILFHVMKDLDELKKICFSAYTCGAFECYESSIDFYTSVACVISEDKDFTYNHLKLLASRNPDNNQTWNLLGITMSNIYQDLRHNRFCLRLFAKNPELMPLKLFKGHNELMSGSYKQALGEYMAVFEEKPNDPFPALCIAITFLSLSCQRYVSSKYLCLFQTIAFLHIYLELRGTCQETMFNIGRVFHQMNMLDKAVIFYKKALSMSPKDNLKLSDNNSELSDEVYEMYDVRQEAAFNLALIYKNSQSYGLAYNVIKDNFTI